jgi:hypothetical protein
MVKFLALKSLNEMVVKISTPRRLRRLQFYSKDIVALSKCWRLDILDAWDKYHWYYSMMQIFEITHGEFMLPVGLITTWGAQFALSKEAIQRYSYDQYLKIKSISDKNYYLPWGLEKYWLYLYSDNNPADFKIKYYF